MSTSTSLLTSSPSPTSTTLSALLRGLPPELRLMILSYATGVDVLPVRKAARQRGVVCMVCLEWARLTYAVRTVWTRIAVNFASGFEFNPVKACLVNSGDLPLEIDIDVLRQETRDGEAVPVASPVIQRFIHQYFTLFAPHFGRVRTFTMYCPDRDGSDLALTYLTRMDCAKLEELTLSINPTAAGTLTENRTFSSLPALKSISSAKTLPPVSLHVAAGTVTQLDVAELLVAPRPRWNEWERTLRTFSNVEQLKLRYVGSADRPPEPTETSRIVLQRLRSLTLSFSDPRTVHIARFVHAPNLRILQLNINAPACVLWFLVDCKHLLGLPAVVHLFWRRVTALDECLNVFNALTGAMTLVLHHIGTENIEAQKAVLGALCSPALSLPLLRRVTIDWVVDDTEAKLILAEGRMHRDLSLTSLLTDKPGSYTTRVMGRDDIVVM
ncbi:hypothetical protein C8R47DRAFT_1144583 [Mycena vitilis]|nr:hypothetical protein C8R47DRAFT_1144583 [Mycena vitilis]